ncbi:MAG: Group 1 glycosyl transferase [Microgenomates group bacterium Gr01-1014_93]|nr:MAG: Group 1 glycosyl transferase [Microgenomates group bacterium Gr01-1014_93]
MNICVVTHTFPRNEGDIAAAFMKEFCDALVENGQKVILITPFDQKFNRRGDRFKIVTYKYIWPDKFHLLGYSRTMEADVELKWWVFFLIPFMSFFGTLALFKIVRREKIDIINAHWIIPNGLMSMIVSKLTGVPYVITLPGTDAYLATRFKIIGWISKIIARYSDGVFSNSSLHLERILKLGFKPKYKGVISYPSDVSRFKPSKEGIDVIRKRHRIKSSEIIVLAVGRLVYKKGFDYLIKALVPLKHYSLKLLIGGEGDLKLNWQKLVARLGLLDKVLFVGEIKRNEIAYYYNLADIIVAPSIIDKKGNVDGGPVVCFESMACGKPQIVTNVLGIADIIKNGINGFVIPQKSSGAITQALEKLIKSKKLREKMGEENKRLVKLNLSTKAIGKIYLNYFMEIALKN